jgi:hypothetical protein
MADGPTTQFAPWSSLWNRVIGSSVVAKFRLAYCIDPATYLAATMLAPVATGGGAIGAKRTAP